MLAHEDLFDNMCTIYREALVNLHEYQVKKILRSFGIETLPGFVAYTTQEIREKIDSLSGSSWVIKAQIQAGGRGKSGGVKIVKSLQELESFGKKLLGSRLVTPQTGPEGKLVRKVYVEEVCDFVHEYYLSLSVERSSQGFCLLISKKGGVDIEVAAQEEPESLLRVHINPLQGIWPHQCRKIAYFLGLPRGAAQELETFLGCLYRMATGCDAQMIEINPLVLTREGQLLPLDSKMVVDDNALFRHNDLRDLCDQEELSAAEMESQKLGLSYIKLDGSVGCMVNGAGLAMATLDLLQYHGLKAANFLDVGGGSSREKVTSAFRFILSDPDVECILINIFGGIMRCDILAEGIIQAVKDFKLNIPVVIRLEGTKSEDGLRLLNQANLDIYPTQTLEEAAKLIVSLAHDRKHK